MGASYALLAEAMAVMLLLLGLLLWLSYQDQVRNAKSNTLNVASIFEERFDATLRRTDADLLALISEIPLQALDPSGVRAYGREVMAALDRRMSNREDFLGFRVHDAKGDLLYHSASLRLAALNISDRDYFRQARDNPSQGVVISDALTGRGTRMPVLSMTRALRGVGGEFLGVVYGVIDLGYYRRQFQAIDLGRDGVISLRRDTHAPVLRVPELAGDMLKPPRSDHPLVRSQASGERAISFEDEAEPDSVPRIVSAVHLGDYPLYVTVGRGRDEVLASWYRQVAVVVAAALVLMVLVVLLLARLRSSQAWQRAVLDELAAGEAQFRELAQLVPVGIGQFDHQGVCTYVNDRCAEIIGQGKEVLLGVRWADFVHPEDRAGIFASVTSEAEQGKSLVRELRLQKPDDDIVHVQVEVRAGIGKDGEVRGYLAALTDISERKEAEGLLLEAKQRAENADRSKTRFLAAASHDLRQPIQAINLFLGALEHSGLGDEQKKITSLLSRSVGALGELLYSLLDVHKLNEGEITPHPRVIAIDDLFRAIDEEFSCVAQQKGLRFKLFFPMAGVGLFADPGLLMSVIRNLLGNAFKYTERGGVLVGARRRAGELALQVWDTGRGIGPEHGEIIFEEGFQAGSTVLERSKGVGLGLAIARRMAALMGCRLAYSSRLGKGSMFELIVPLSGHDRPSAAEVAACVEMRPAEHDASAFRGWRVVVIEDDPMVAEAMELSLAEIGMCVSVFHCGEDALASADLLLADFYLSDFNLPGMNGAETLRAIQARVPTPMRAVLMTGDTVLPPALAEGVAEWPVLIKPVELARLLAVMEKMSGGRSATG